VRWDSARLDDGRWTVTAVFPAGGRERLASWQFDPRLRSLVPSNDEARWLSEDSTGDSAIPTPHVATNSNRASAVFDVEAEGGVDDSPARRARSREPIDLMAAMREQSSRSRRGRRRSSPTHTAVEESPREDALPLEELVMDLADAPEPPAARGEHPVSAHLDERAEGEPDESAETQGNVRQFDRGTPAPADADHAGARSGDDAGDPLDDETPGDDTSGDDREPTDDAEGTHDAGAATEDEPVEDAPAPKPSSPQPRTTPKSGARKSGRPSVPSWDDIMFGGRGGSTT
jgi:hypothetical protein